MYILDLPLYVQITKKKKFYFNLNTYRNAPFHQLSDVKIAFGKLIEKKVSELPELGCVGLSYTLFPGRKNDPDVANICSIVDKFFSDVLVTQGKLVDDNCNIVKGVQYLYGKVDKSNPRVEVAIHQVEESFTNLE